MTDEAVMTPEVLRVRVLALLLDTFVPGIESSRACAAVDAVIALVREQVAREIEAAIARGES